MGDCGPVVFNLFIDFPPHDKVSTALVGLLMTKTIPSSPTAIHAGPGHKINQ